MPQRCLLLLLDGLGDRGHAELDGRSPLQAAYTPVLDGMAASGSNGLFHALGPGRALPSELAHWLMWGYSQAAFPGRGAIEALGHGLDMGPEDVAIMARLVHVEQEQGCLRLVKDTPRQTGPGDLQELAAALPDLELEGMRLRFEHIKGLHGLLLLRSAGGVPSPLITDTNPIRDGAWLIEPKPLAEAGNDRAATLTARALKHYLLEAHKVLRGHGVNRKREAAGLAPLNALATQRAGRLAMPRPFAARTGLKGAVIGSGGLFRGLARLTGMTFIEARDSDDPGRDMAKRLELARAALKEHAFVHVHTKAPDVAAHTKVCRHKQRVIEALDQGLEALPAMAGDPGLLVAVTADHSTPSSGALIHSGEPVPLLVHGQGVRPDEVQRFDEVAAASGALGFLRGSDLLHTLLDFLDRSRLVGLRDTPRTFDDAPAWPGEYEPFSLE